jgi:CheY-like chemotaxis protein
MPTSSLPPQSTAHGRDGEPEAAPVILLVEDDEPLRYALARGLRQAGYRVLDTGSSIEAIAFLDGGETVDLLVTDIIVPGRPHGFALGRMARLRRRDLKIIYLTGLSSLPEIELADAAGTVLQKPIDPDRLIDEIGRALADAPPAR